MLKFSSLLTSKKIIIFALLLVMFAIPSITGAQNYPPTYAAEVEAANTKAVADAAAKPFGSGTWLGRLASWLGAQSVPVAGCDMGVWPLYKQFGGALADMGTAVARSTSKISVDIASSAMTIKDWPITKGTENKNGAGAKAFSAGWKATRDLANMLIVLGFVIVGIATALRIREYEAKKALFPLIIVALIINFSGLFCGLIIDAGNLTMTGLLNGGSSMTMGTTYLNQIGGLEKQLTCNAVSSGSFVEYAAASAGISFVYLLIGVSFFIIAALMVARYAILGILFIMSPLAFACYAFPFPKAKGLFEKWWGYFLDWSFVGVSITFFINIAGQIANAAPAITMEGGTLIYLAVVLEVIIVGIYASVKSSPTIAGAVVGVAKGAGAMALGAAGGAALGLGKIADKLTGGVASNSAQKLKSGYGRVMERVGLRATGTTASANSKAVDNEAGLMAKEYASAKATGNQGSMDRIHRLARNGRGAQAAAAMKVLADNKDLGNAFGGNLSGMADRMSYAEANGATGIREKAEKLDPRLRAFNKQHLDKHGGDEVAAIGEGYAKASVDDIREYSTDTLKDKQFLYRVSHKKMEKAGENMSTEKVDAIKTHKIDALIEARINPDPVKRGEYLNKYHTILGL